MNFIKKMLRSAQNNPISRWNTFMNFIRQRKRKIKNSAKKVCFSSKKTSKNIGRAIKRVSINIDNKIPRVKTKKVEKLKKFKIKRKKVLTLETAIPKEIIVESSPKSYISEPFRTLRTNIQFMNANKDVRTILVTSTVTSEGKSYVASNLGAVFAQANKKVIIVDSDMRKGRVHEIFKIDQRPGLSNFLSGVNDEKKEVKTLNGYIKETSINNLYVLPMGDVPPNPSELIASEKMRDLIENLKAKFDIIIFDGTPSKIVTDSIILSREVDTTLIVSRYNKTKIDDLNKVKKDIENVGGKIAGVVINDAPVSKKVYSNSYYYENNGGI